jgi:hypothetical protein
LVPLVFFSFSGSKLPGYILPAVPPAAILSSLYIYEIVNRSKIWRRAILLIAGSTLIATLLILDFAVPRFVQEHSVKSLIAAADQRGYISNRVLTLHTASLNAEFYAAGRLLKDETGKQRWLSGVGEVEAEIKAEGGNTVLVLVPIQYRSQLTSYGKLRSEYLADNGELAIVAVSMN